MRLIRSLLDHLGQPTLALAGPDGECGFDRLGARAGAVQTALRRLPAGAVLIHGHKEADAVAAMLACAADARPFCFVDRSQPPARVERVARIAGAVCLIACGEPPACALPTLRAADLADAPLSPGADAPDEAVFYYIFTSGSSGEPKGIAISRGNFAAFDDWYGPQLAISPGDGLHLNHANLAFDMGMLDLWPVLSRGRGVLMLDHANNALPRQNLRLMQRYAARLRSAMATPSFMATLCRDALFRAEGFPALADIYIAGEAAPPALCAQLFERFPAARRWNGYGPSETTCMSHTQALAPEVRSAAALSSFDAASAHCRVEVWNAAGEPVIGEAGEVVIFGPQVAGGYLPASLPQNRAFGERNGERYYRSGDGGTLDADGRLWLHGRLDRQVKINGNRVELAEIERRALACPGVEEAVAMAHQDDGGVELLLFVGGAAEAAALAGYLARHLPPYMLPRRIFHSQALPFNRNGKIDRARLLAEASRAQEVA